MLPLSQSPAFSLISLILSLFATALAIATPSSRLVMGTIQFPNALQHVPSLRIYYAGHRIKTEAHEEAKQISFAVPRGPAQNKFFLLITQDVDFSPIKNVSRELTHNTIEYFKVAHNHPYKLYELELVEDTPTAENASDPAKKTSSPSQRWVINEHFLVHDNLRMPDMTIIMRYNPDFIELLRPGNAFELPTIVIRHDLLSLVGSEQQLHTLSNELIISSIDLDTVHTVLAESIKTDQQRTLIAAPTA